jgi:ubiquinone/menaquinone biosynthesis C-methylase UbiE
MTTHKYDPANMDRLLAPNRYEQLDIHRIFSLLPLTHYQTIADIGCGPGFFTIPLAKTLWEGKVYALDIQKEMLEACRRRVEEARLGNVEVMLSKEAKFPLEASSLDGAMVSLVLHSQINKAAFLKAVVKLMKPSGWLAFINWHLVAEPTQGPPAERRISVEDVLSLVEDAGLRVELRRDLTEELYLLVLRK